MDKTLKTSQYRATLPERVEARIESSEDGLWAYLSTKDGRLSHCYTQAANMTELLPMINDAILTSFEIPEEYRGDVGYYIPLGEEHVKIEEILNRMIAIEKQASASGESLATLTLKDAMLQVC